jgi:chemotaxis response regulator CheB
MRWAPASKVPPTVFVADCASGVAEQVKGWARAGLDSIHIQVFDTARQLLRRMEYQRPDLLVLDVTFPQFDGWTALRSERLRGTPVVLISPDTLPGARLTTEALLGGARDYIIRRGSGARAHLATSLSRFVATARRTLDAQRGSRDADQKLPRWTHLQLREEGGGRTAAPNGPQPARDEQATLVLATPRNLPRLVAAAERLADSCAGPVILGIPQPQRFSRALRELLTRRWNRPVLDLRDGERLRPGQWRLLPGRALLKPNSGNARYGLQPNRLSDAERAIGRQLELLAGAGSALRVLLCEPLSGGVTPGIAVGRGPSAPGLENAGGVA